MSATSVKANASAFIESKAVDVNCPFAILAAMEETFNRGALFTPITPMELNTTMAARATKTLLRASLGKLAYETPVNDEAALLRAKRLQKAAIRNNFGKYGPDDYETTLIAKAKETTVSREDRLAALVYGIEKIHSFREWKIQMDEPQQLKNFDALEGHTFELPPHKAPKMLVHKKGCRKILKAKINPKLQAKAEKLGWTPIKTETGGWHEDAYYSITLPDGRVADMRLKQGNHMPKTENYPSFGMRMLATRLGFIKPGERYKGGDTKILNMMLGEDQIDWVDPKNPRNEDGTPKTQKVWKWLPAYEAEIIANIWLRNVWEVKVGWRPNPKITPSQFWVDIDGELTLSNPNILRDESGAVFELTADDEDYIPPLSISELDYQTLSDTKDLAVEDEEGEVVEYMNEEEEFLTMFPDRDTENQFVNFSQYVAGEGEGDYDDDELKLLKECSYNLERSESGITMGDLQSQQMIRHLGRQIDEATQEMLDAPEESEELKAALKKLGKAKRADKGWNEFIGYQPDHAMVRYWYPTLYSRLYRSLDFNEPVTVVPGASIMPDNEIERHVVVSHDLRPWPARTFQMTLGQSKQLRRQKMVCASIIHGRFGMLVREKNAQDAFSMALEEALRA